MIYLDNAATTYPKPEEVYQAMVDALKNKGANPGRGAHRLAIEAGRVIFDTRNLLASLISARKAEEIIFTSGATESINLVLKGLLVPGDHVITTSMEHNAVYRPLKALEQQGIKITIVQADEKGYISAKDVEKAVIPATKLIIVNHASNVCGAVMPVTAIGEVAKNANIYFAVDGSQSLGLLPIDVQNMHIDFLAFPGHKGLYGPSGVGGVYVKSGITLKPLIEGGTGVSSSLPEMPEIIPERYEAGTLNLPGIAGLGAGVCYVNKIGLANIVRQGQALLEVITEGLAQVPGIKIYAPKTGAGVPVVSFNLANHDAAEVALLLDKKYDIAVRAGLHCAPLAHRTLGTEMTGAVRISAGTFNTEKEIMVALQAILEISNM